MAFSDDVLLPDNKCEICGAALSDEVVMQEFADGSIARLCAECAAGAALQPEGDEFRFPEVEERESDDNDSALDDSALDDSSGSLDSSESFEKLDEVAAATAAAGSCEEPDPMDKTRELLTPVVDLITLQREMQGALQRLAASLETFATGVITENLDKTATVESRLESLERELELTRARLRETEALLAAGGVAATTGAPVPGAAVGAVALAPETGEGAGLAGVAAVAAAGAAVAGAWDSESTMESTADITDSGETTGAGVAEQTAQAEPPVGAAAVAAAAAAAAQWPTAGDTEPEPYSAADVAAQSTPPPTATPLVPPPVAPPAGPPTAEHHSRPGFQLPEVQVAQKYFNESQYTDRIRDVRKSLGKPKANLTKLIGPEPRAIVTITWDIIWYQYLIDLRREVSSELRVTLHREGMDLDELTGIFKEKNASIDDEGRLDASELEVKLLSDPSTLITEMTVDEERALEDATEEIWDQRTAPEFKWDD